MADGTVIIDTLLDSSGFEEGVGKLKGLASKGMAIVTKSIAATGAAIAIASTGIAALTKASIEQYSQYEQLTGGVETLFKNSSNTVMQYANNAYKAAGMSANEYMSTITGFSASLLQGLGGDTEKAAQVGNMAVEDMSDNANKMGSNMQDIQNAYQGFAKQNYTMLDNLKLGYGGTQTEMQRLLTDAEKLSGIHYEMSNFADVIEAIHVIQNEMGITGTTAKEAASTIEGSLNMTKSAWTNLLTGMADDDADFDTLVDNFVDSIGTFGENILPRVEIALNGIGELIDELLPIIMDKVPDIIISILPGIAEAGTNIVASLGSGIAEALPTIIDLGMQAVQSLSQGIADNAAEVTETGITLITNLAESMAENAPEIIKNVVDGILDTIMSIADNIGELNQAGADLLVGIAEGISEALPSLAEKAPEIITALVVGIVENQDLLIEAGGKIIIALAIGIIKSIPELLKIPFEIGQRLAEKFNEIDWGETGRNIITGIGVGIKNSAGALYDKACEIANNIKDKIKGALDIHSPSRVMAREIGVFIPAGIKVGIEQGTPELLNSAKDVCDQLTDTFANGLNADVAQSYIDNIKGVSGTFSDLYNDLSAAQENVNWANGLTLDDNKWYYDAKTRLEDVKSQLEDLSEQISDTEDKNAKKSLQEQQKTLQKKQKLIQKEYDYYKQAAQDEINERKKATKEELKIAKEKYSKLEEFSKALTTAIKNQINEQKSATLDGIDAELSKLEERYNKESDRIDANSEKKKARIQSEIDKLDEEAEAENRLKEIQEANNNIAVLQAKMNNTASEADKKAYALKIKNARAALEEKRKEWDRTDEKAALQEEQNEIEERASKRKERLKAEYEEEKENLKKKKEAAEEYYNKLLETDSINAQARYMILTRSNDELVQLLQSYNPLWQDAGQSLADSLINGLNSKRQDMANVVAEMTSFRNGVEVNLDGYATGTSSNRLAGMYTVDEKGFELSTGNNPVAYVSKGAGILNHMQSLKAIKDEVSSQVANQMQAIKNMVLGQQQQQMYAFAGAMSGSTTNNSSVREGDVIFHVDNFHNDNKDSIENIANELGFYAKRKKRC